MAVHFHEEDIPAGLFGPGAIAVDTETMGLITPRDRLGRMVGLQAAAQAIGLAMGPALGGLLLEAGSWRLLFLVNVPAGLVGIATATALLPRSRDLAPPRRIDPRGIALFAPAVGLALLAMSLAPQHGRLTAGVAAAVGALAVAALFVRHQRRTTGPLVPARVLEAPGLRPGLVAAFCGYAVLFGTLVVVPLFLLRSAAAGPSSTGLMLASLPLGIGVVAPIAGRLSDLAPRAVAKSGLLLAAACLVALAATRPTGVLLAALLGVAGVGLGAFTPANNRSVMMAAPVGTSGAVAGLLNMTRGLGTAAGTAVSVLVFTAAGGASVGMSMALAALAVLGVVGLLTE